MDGNPDLSCDVEIGAGGILEQDCCCGYFESEGQDKLLVHWGAAEKLKVVQPAGPINVTGTAHLVLTQREVDQLAGRINVLLNRGAARGGEGDIAHLDLCEVVELVKRINKIFNLCAARGDEGVTSYLDRCKVVELVRRINMILNPGAARGGEGNTPHLAGMQINPLVGGGECGGTAPHLARLQFYLLPDSIRALNNMFLESHTINKGTQFYKLPDSVPLNNMSTSPGNYPPGFAPAATSRPRNNMLLGSHSMDIKDEEPPQSTDFMIPKPNNMYFLEWSAVLTFSLYATGMQATFLMPKYYSRTILGLLAVSLICFFAVKLFYKKLPAKIANLATSLAIVCNGSCVLLMAGFFLAKILSLE